MPLVLSFLVRALLLATGLVFAVGFAVLVAGISLVLLGAWAVRAGWARLTGRPVTPFVMRMGPRSAFEEMMRRAQAPASHRADPGGARRPVGDVTDVEPKR